MNADDKGQSPTSSELERYSISQDSAYYKALNEKIPNFLRIERALILEEILNDNNNLSSLSKAELIRQNINSIPSKYLVPNPVDVVHHDEAIFESMEVPFISTIPKYGFKIPIADILTMVGVMEDVSPAIRYRLEYKADIEIVIYSINAAVIATIYSGEQIAGEHIRTWNLRDDMGRLMPTGDYIAEVRIGKERYVRKKIKIP